MAALSAEAFIRTYDNKFMTEISPEDTLRVLTQKAN
jgi:hypothetical protein